ncbi:S8 family serine peptidase [Arthrobacter cupressi]|uniref:Type VII secretion-associated serine protease mycosin n=1 Tax=Arthrobacter cupressi TaxID=1045773 RepID=A0A1G8IPK7_9MICC|nr:type VII secretion-associated serine protease mycosin [Arthrobacter cupressi]SDI20741.1 type VII secretion-associated serine protease mycosin [Arthrobacter cupressi]
MARLLTATGLRRRHRTFSATLTALLATTGLAAAMAAGGLATASPAAADAWRDKEYWLKESGISEAWKESKGAGVKVAIIDSGVDGRHPDLRGAVVGGTDVSGSGNPDGQKSIGAKPEHGTLVATLLAGRGHQRTSSSSPPASGTSSGGPDGIIGVAPEADILSVSTWLGSPNPAGKTDQEQIPVAVRWAVDHGAKVINISLGSTSPEWPQSWDAAFLYAEQKDVVIVAAAGNRIGGNVQVGAPATIPGVLTVAGLDRDGKASVDSSSQGISIGVAAPAEELIGGMPGGRYAEWAGTSGATPIVSGVAALIRSKWPDMSAKQVVNRIVTTAKDAGVKGKDPIYGYGVLDAKAALSATVPEAKSNPLGSINEWIRVHRRGDFSTPTQEPSPSKKASAKPTLQDPTVPAAKAPAAAGTALPGVVIIGFGAIFIGIVAAAGVQLRRVYRKTPAEPDTGTLDKVEPGTGK